MKDVAPKLQLFGTRGSPAAYAIRNFLARCDVPFAWTELRDDEQARAPAHVSGGGASEGLKTVVVERLAVGGQAATSPKIENYLGFPHGVSGAELVGRAWEQASRFGAENLLLREGVRGAFVPGKGVVYLADGTKIITRLGLRDGNGLPPAQPAERGPAVGRRPPLPRPPDPSLPPRQLPP